MSHVKAEYSPEVAKSTNVCIDAVIQDASIALPDGKVINCQMLLCNPTPPSDEITTGTFWEAFYDELAEIFGSRTTDQPPISLTLIEAHRPQVLSKSFELRGDGTLEKRSGGQLEEGRARRLELATPAEIRCPLGRSQTGAGADARRISSR